MWVTACRHIAHSSSVAASSASTSSMVTSYQASSFQYGSSEPSGIFVIGKTSPCSTTVSRQPSRARDRCRHIHSTPARQAMLAHTMAPTERATAAATWAQRAHRARAR